MHLIANRNLRIDLIEASRDLLSITHNTDFLGYVFINVSIEYLLVKNR